MPGDAKSDFNIRKAKKMNDDRRSNVSINTMPSIGLDGLGSWPCPIQVTWLAADYYHPKDGDLKGFPQRGRGDRCLFCDQYDNCLTLAANNDWEGFDCRRCSYPNKTALNFFFDELGPIDEAVEDGDELLYCSEEQMDRLLFSSYSQQMDALTDLISSLEVDNG